MRPLPFLLAGPLLLLLPAPAEVPDPTFKKELQRLAGQNDKDGMAKLARTRLDDAVAWIVWTGEQIADRPSDEHEAFLKDLREAFQAGLKSEFAEREYEYFKNLGANRKDRTDLKQRLEKAASEFRENLERKDSFVLQNLVDELDILGSGLEQVGDLFQASEAYLMQARGYDEELRGEGADLHRATSAYARAIACREKVDLKDPAFEAAQKRHGALVAKGFDKKPGKEGPGAPAAPEESPLAPASEAGASLTVSLGFEPVPTFDAYERPNYICDEIHPLWFPIPIKAKGSGATFTRVDGAPLIVRMGAADLRVDSNGDGQGDDKLSLTGNITLVKVTLGKGDSARPWAFLAQIGSQKDQYQGIEVNIEPTDREFPIYACPAASVVGSIAGTPVRVIDDNLDGVYGSEPKSWGEVGLTRDNFQPELDSVVIGASKRARPWSEFLEVGGKWYRVETVASPGKELRATPVNVETGILKLDFKGPKPAWVIVKGQNDYKASYFDLVEGGAKGVPVPTGKYTLAYGEVRAGKKKLVRKTLILPGKGTPSWDVKKGQVTTVTLGAPFGFDFRTSLDGEKLTVEGRSISVVGALGERYERPWNCVPRPEASWRRKGTKKASKPDRMPALMDTEGLQKHGWEAAWAPLDLVIEVRGEKGPLDVQLTEKKNDLFGKIESAWKE